MAVCQGSRQARRKRALDRIKATAKGAALFPTLPALAPGRGGAMSARSGILLINAALIKNEIITRRVSVVIDENARFRKLSEAVRKENTLFTIHSFFTSIHSRVTLLTRECTKKRFIVYALLHT